MGWTAVKESAVHPSDQMKITLSVKLQHPPLSGGRSFRGDVDPS